MKIDIERLRDIAWTHWDPIGMLRPGQDWRDTSFKDEYDSYLRRMVKKVLAGKPEGEIVAYAIGSVKHAMLGGYGDGHVREALATVRAVTALVEDARGTKPE